jgi:site-specific DNA-cytosine methylase
MKRGTRSGLLWEVERILRECTELPQVLLMENVPMVVADKHIDDFAEWCTFLEILGYTNNWKVLNAKDYGVPQNRERCFMVSFLGDYSYEFPDPVKLSKKMEDILEEDVDAKFYLTGETADRLCSQLIKVEREREIKSHGQIQRQSVIRHEAHLGHHTGASISRKLVEYRKGIARTVNARDYKGLCNQLMNGVIDEDIREESN